MANKPRKWWVALLLGTGVAQIYNGQALKGLIIILMELALSVWIAWSFYSYDYPLSKLWEPLSVLPRYFDLLGAALWLAIMIDAIWVARKRRHAYELRRYNRVVLYLLLMAAVPATDALLVRSYICRGYKIPGGSMKPTLLIGDRIVVDIRPTAQDPARGDLIVFEYPLDESKDFVKRVAAVGGDTVEIRDKALFVNGERVRENYVTHADPHIGAFGPGKQRDNMGPITIPPDAYFVLGDNRDESYDSRFWGFVEKSKVRGTVRNIWWSMDPESNAVRWSRIGMRLGPPPAPRPPATGELKAEVCDELFVPPHGGAA